MGERVIGGIIFIIAGLFFVGIGIFVAAMGLLTLGAAPIIIIKGPDKRI